MQRSLVSIVAVISFLLGVLCTAPLASQNIVVRGKVVFKGDPTKSMLEDGYATKGSNGLRWVVVCLESDDDSHSDKPISAKFAFTEAEGPQPLMALCGVGGKISVFNQRKESVFVQLSGYDIRDVDVLKNMADLTVDVGPQENNPITIAGFWEKGKIAYAIPVKTKYAAFTDEAGAFEIKDVPAGAYKLQLQHVGYSKRLFKKYNSTEIRLEATPRFEIPPMEVEIVP